MEITLERHGDELKVRRTNYDGATSKLSPRAFIRKVRPVDGYEKWPIPVFKNPISDSFSFGGAGGNQAVEFLAELAEDLVVWVRPERFGPSFEIHEIRAAP